MKPTRVAPPDLHDGEPSETRRALLGFLGLFGATALAGCGTADANGVAEASAGISTERLGETMTLASIRWVDTALGTVSANGARQGVLAQTDAAMLGATVV